MLAVERFYEGHYVIYCMLHVSFGGLVGGGCSVVYYRSDGDTWFMDL